MSSIHHYFFPHYTNNQKAKILHSSSLAVIIGVFTIFQIILGQVSSRYPFILGYAAQIKPTEIVRLTNHERQTRGLSALNLNEKLSAAAAKKASDMFAKNYWAHVSPTGTQPWYFITDSGYAYRFAGENLARDFSDPGAVVTAWMNSPTHRDNLLNSRYQEIGVAVVDGSLQGRETTLVVQMFGTQLAAAPAVDQKSASINVLANDAPYPEIAVLPTSVPVPDQLPASNAYLTTETRGSISPYELTRYASLGLLVVLALVLVADIVIVNRRKIVRWTSRSFAHLVFVLVLLIAAGAVLRGQII